MCHQLVSFDTQIKTTTTTPTYAHIKKTLKRVALCSALRRKSLLFYNYREQNNAKQRIKWKLLKKIVFNGNHSEFNKQKTTEQKASSQEPLQYGVFIEIFFVKTSVTLLCLSLHGNVMCFSTRTFKRLIFRCTEYASQKICIPKMRSWLEYCENRLFVFILSSSCNVLAIPDVKKVSMECLELFNL